MTLGLNIVTATPTADAASVAMTMTSTSMTGTGTSTSTSTTAESTLITTKNNKNKKRRRMNKYEKRRQKSAIAKEKKSLNELADEQREQEEQGVVDISNNNTNDETNLVQSEHDETLCDLDEIINDNNNNKHLQNGDDDDKNLLVERKHDDDNKNHAAYMAEYHARPLELDRRNNATVTLSNSNKIRRKHTRMQQLLPEDDAKKQDVAYNNHSSSSSSTSTTPTTTTSTTDTSTSTSTDSVFPATTEWKDLPLDDRIVSVLTTTVTATTTTAVTTMDHHPSKYNKRNLRYHRPTRIQERVIQTILKRRNNTNKNHNHNQNNFMYENVWIQSETGSGKTMAYFLPVFQLLLEELSSSDDTNSTSYQTNNKHTSTTTATTTTAAAANDRRQELGTRCIIVCPTQELVQQTQHSLQHLVQHVCAGNGVVVGSFCAQTSRSKEKARLRKGITILVTTPGRLLDHLKTTQVFATYSVTKLQWLVLDEVDRLFDMGLAPQLQDVIRLVKDSTNTTQNNGIPGWRSILVSATVPKEVQTVVQTALSSSSSSSSVTKTSIASNKEWAWIQGEEKQEEEDSSLQQQSHSQSQKQQTSEKHSVGRSLPQHLVQYHINVSAKLRLTTLLAFLVDRVAQNQRTVVFMSTCASVDYYHALFTKMESILSHQKGHNADTNDNDNMQPKGIFGNACTIHKLHGNVPHFERRAVLETFRQEKIHGNTTARILLATDVAARGLNLQADWTVQFDPPCEIADYIHRAGRVARAGQFGQSLLFLLPSEKSLLSILQLHQEQSQQQQRRRQQQPASLADNTTLREMPALSLSSTLQRAAKVCPNLTREGMNRNGISSKTGPSSSKDAVPETSAGPGVHKTHRLGEAFCSELQYRLEECVLKHSKAVKNAEGLDNADNTNQDRKRKKHEAKKKKSADDMTLADMARNAFLSHMRAYPTKEKAVRHIFSARALHLGHIAKSFAMRETPKTLVKNSRGVLAEPGKKRNAALAFSWPTTRGVGSSNNDAADLDDSKRNGNSAAAARKRAMLMANAAKLQVGGIDGF